MGVGFALYVEGTGMGPFEGATVTLQPSGRVHIATGACSSGQGHRTAYAQIAADVLQVPIEQIVALADVSKAATAAVVALGPDTGVVTIERFVVVHDCGRVVNPMIADAQIAGGVMQGIGGVLYEEMVYDGHGQPLSGTFMDYAMPVATQAPPIVMDHIESRELISTPGKVVLGSGR